jgi:hypothetical protein
MGLHINKTMMLIIFIYLAGFFSGCHEQSPYLIDEDTGIYYPKKLDTALVNPFIGWAPSASVSETSQPHSLVYTGVSWKELEPVKGVYKFEEVERDNRFEHWKGKGVKVILRLYLDYPGEETHSDIPDWLYNETQKDGKWYNIEYGKGYSPNYNNKYLIQCHEKLIKALADRYDQNPQIAFIEIGSLGHWGEWHTNIKEKHEISFPEIDVCNIYVQHYLNSFKNKLLLVRRPLKIAMDNNLGLFNDSFGAPEQTEDSFVKWFNEGYFDSQSGVKQPAMPDFWKFAPSGGEVFNSPGLIYFDNFHIDNTIKQLSESHISWLGPGCPIYGGSGPESKANIALAQKNMGYRFRINSIETLVKAKPGCDIPVKIELINEGVAPMYYNWHFELSLCDQSMNPIIRKNCNADIRNWLPGIPVNISDHIQLPMDIAPGTYFLSYSINDLETNKPGVNFANYGRMDNGRYKIGKLSVLK